MYFLLLDTFQWGWKVYPKLVVFTAHSSIKHLQRSFYLDGGGEQLHIALSTHLGESHSLHGIKSHEGSPFGTKREEVGWIALAHLDRVWGIVNSYKLAPWFGEVGQGLGICGVYIKLFDW